MTRTVTVKRIPDASIDRGATDFTTTTFNGVPTFRKCDPITSFQFRFLNVSTTAAIINGYTIKWGDSSPDSSFASWPASTIIAHTYPRGPYTHRLFRKMRLSM